MTVSGETLRDNVVVELTPVGRGAVAVALVVGPDAMRLVDTSFRAARGRSIENAPVDRILFGRWGGPAGEELVVCRRAADRVEIHCHGGVAAVAGVIQTLKEQGCGHVSWQEWLLRDSGDPIRASAQIALAEAPTARTAAILLDQFHGALASEIRIARDATASGEWSQAATKIDAILANRNVGAHLTTPWRVVLAGAPNVGKSSLINALAGYERAIVSPLPGTTRDVVSTCTAIDGWPVELADTAGLRVTNDPLESAGIALATSAASDADLVLIVEDARHFTLAALAEPQPVLSAERYVHVWNKIDLVAERPPEADSGATDRQLEYRSVFTSAVTGEGIAMLIDAITATLVSAPPAAGAAVPFTEAQVEALEGASAAIARRDGAAACQALQALLAS